MKRLAKISREWNRMVTNITDFFPYILIWHWKKWRKKTDGMVAYFVYPMHYAMFSNIHRYLPEIKIVAANQRMAEYLQSKNIPYYRKRLYPDLVIFADYYRKKYPVRQIKRVQIFHGVGCKNYFKTYVNKNEYCLVPGYSWAEKLQQCGVKDLEVVGCPKADALFRREWDRSELLQSFGGDPHKKTIFYAPTWGKFSSVAQIHTLLGELAKQYNVIVKLHDHSVEEWRETYQTIPKIILGEEVDSTQYLFVADLLISDFSSIIFEFTPLYRPIIVFGISDQILLENAPEPSWWEVTERIDDLETLRPKIAQLLNGSWKPHVKHQQIVETVFSFRDGQSTERAVAAIKRINDKEVL